MLPYLGCCDNAAVSRGIQVGLQDNDFVWTYIQKWDCCLLGISIYRFLRNSHLLSTVAAPIQSLIHSAQGVPFLHILANMLFLVSLMTAIPTGVRWCLTSVWICISLMMTDVGHFFTCLLTICRSSLFRSSAHFSSLSILDIHPLADIWSANSLSHPTECLFILWFLLLRRF